MQYDNYVYDYCLVDCVVDRQVLIPAKHLAKAVYRLFPQMWVQKANNCFVSYSYKTKKKLFYVPRLVVSS